MTTEQIAELIAEDAYEFYGLRITGEALPVGEIAPESRVWIDGEITDELLDGTSAVKVTASSIDRAMRMLSIYPGAHLSLLGSFAMTYGEDDGEIVMREAVVLASIAR